MNSKFKKGSDNFSIFALFYQLVWKEPFGQRKQFFEVNFFTTKN